MKTTNNSSAFSLVELLTVIAIIGILAAMILAVIVDVRKTAKVTTAKIQMSQILAAIQGYENTYGRFPVSHAAQAAANPDFTYGGAIKTPTSTFNVGTPVGSSAYLQNDQVVAILMNFTNYPNTATATTDANYQANSQKTEFLNAKMAGDMVSPGVGTDLVYRDPWGNPYIISVDLNDDGLCEDAFYKSPSVSTNGLNGLILQPDGNYAFHSSVMVWSAGPDGKLNTALIAILGENKDNVLSWR